MIQMIHTSVSRHWFQISDLPTIAQSPLRFIIVENNNAVEFVHRMALFEIGMPVYYRIFSIAQLIPTDAYRFGCCQSLSGSACFMNADSVKRKVILNQFS